uniref:Uncharacterized protein n=1 Tax=Arion vulgaris TaxID=1028688 RepID=A0A0B6YY45_9EUPU
MKCNHHQVIELLIIVIMNLNNSLSLTLMINYVVNILPGHDVRLYSIFSPCHPTSPF